MVKTKASQNLFSDLYDQYFFDCVHSLFSLTHTHTDIVLLSVLVAQSYFGDKKPPANCHPQTVKQTELANHGLHHHLACVLLLLERG